MIIQDLFELFDKRVQVKYRKYSTEWVGMFGIDNNIYKIYFNRFASSEWTVDFTYVNDAGEETYLPTGTGKAMAVLSTVFNEIADFLAAVDPDMLSFTGRHDTGQSRLYARIMRSFLAPKATALGYDLDSANYEPHTEFVIIKPGYVENDDLYEGKAEIASQEIYGKELVAPGSPARSTADAAVRAIQADPELSKIVDLLLTIRDDDTVELTFIETLKQRKRGHAGRALDLLLNAADQHGARLVLKASFATGTGSRGVLKQQELERFYRRRGFSDFEPEPGSRRWMQRSPS